MVVVVVAVVVVMVVVVVGGGELLQYLATLRSTMVWKKLCWREKKQKQATTKMRKGHRISLEEKDIKTK